MEEQTKEVIVEEVKEQVREIPSRLQYFKGKVLAQPTRNHIIVGVAALAVGAGVGYILGKRNKYEGVVEVESDRHIDPNQMKIEFDSDELAQELAEIHDYVEQSREKRMRAALVIEDDDEDEEERESVEDLVMHKEGPAVEDFVAERIKAAMTSPGALDPEDEVVVESVFAGGDDDWDLEAEKLNRTPASPYVIHKDEFFADEKNYTQRTLTYFAGDQIMVDEDESPVYNHQNITGPLKFGHGSGDKSVFYVRNDKFKSEYEIILHEGIYTVEVLGLDITDNQRTRDNPRDREIRHSAYRKFRPED